MPTAQSEPRARSLRVHRRRRRCRRPLATAAAGHRWRCAARGSGYGDRCHNRRGRTACRRGSRRCHRLRDFHSVRKKKSKMSHEKL